MTNQHEAMANEMLKKYPPSERAKRVAFRKVYRELESNGVHVAILNDKYLIIEGQEYSIAKSGSNLVLKKW